MLHKAGLSVPADTSHTPRPMGGHILAPQNQAIIHSAFPMNMPTISLLSSRPAPPAGPGARSLVTAMLAYVSAVSATVGAAAAVVGAGIPLDLLLTVA